MACPAQAGSHGRAGGAEQRDPHDRRRRPLDQPGPRARQRRLPLHLAAGPDGRRRGPARGGGRARAVRGTPALGEGVDRACGGGGPALPPVRRLRGAHAPARPHGQAAQRPGGPLLPPLTLAGRTPASITPSAPVRRPGADEGRAAAVWEGLGMAATRRPFVPAWSTVAPVVAVVALVLTWGRTLGPLPVTLVALVLAAAVLSAVHHAEVVAHRVGEPFGSLVLAVAVTVIEVALILTLMVSGGPESASLARDTVFAAVMITVNGILGLSLFVGALRHGLTLFNAEGTGAALATVTSLATLSLVLPRFTSSRSGPEFSPAQLPFAAAASLLLYGAFVVTQTVRHRDFFLPVPVPRTAPDGGDTGAALDSAPGSDTETHAEPPSGAETLRSLGLLALALVAVVGLAKVESPAIEAGVAAVGFPPSFVGVVIALLVLLPETLAASRNALRDRVQTSLNLALGSAMASIGLTIPVIALATIWIDVPLQLGLGPTQMVLLALTVVITALTVVPGRATRLQGVVHLVLLAAFLFLAILP